MDQRCKLLNREDALVAGLLTDGLFNLRRINLGDYKYYAAFYNLSIGLERLLKLLFFERQRY
ncbi:MAG: hypothetical protein M0R03_20080 [Novosphingobium sp.]|nr:hypothetical protein [Novosphingobium sp.]